LTVDKTKSESLVWTSSCAGEGVSLQMSAAVQSVASVQQQQQQPAGRPTQQVQPVSSHFEEATGNLAHMNLYSNLILYLHGTVSRIMLKK